MSLEDTFRFVLNRFDGEYNLEGKEVRHFWNPVRNEGSEVEDTPFATVWRCALLVDQINRSCVVL